VQVKGRVAAPPSRLYEFSAGDSAQGSSRIRQNLDLAAFRSETQLPLLDLSVVQLGSLVKACSATGLSSPRASINTMVTHFNGSGFAA
jgi:hypothetical protein